MSAVQVIPREAAAPQKRGQSEGVSDESHDDKKQRRPGRKPITAEAPSKRIAQNRAAQRAFRERKQQYLKGLEDKVRELTEQQERTERENQELKRHIDSLRSENSSLRSAKFTYESAPDADNSAAISDLLFQPSARSSGLDLSAVLDMQQAALSGADLTRPGAMAAIAPPRPSVSAAAAAAGTAATPSASASPQNVPIMNGNMDIVSTTTTAVAPGSVAGGFSSDIIGGIQMLASTTAQDIGTGTVLSQLLDTTTASAAPAISTAGIPELIAASSGTAIHTAAGGSPLSSATVATPGEMLAPLDPGGVFFGAGAFKDSAGYMASFASLISQQQQQQQQQQISTASQSSGFPPTPSFSELLSLSPQQVAASLQIPAASLQVPANSLQMPATTTTTGSDSAGIPAYLMAYRNPDPFSIGDDGDQLEKLLLSSMYSEAAPSTTGTAAAQAQLQSQPQPQQPQQSLSPVDLALLVASAAAAAPPPPSAGGSDAKGATGADNAIPENAGCIAGPLCTCRSVDGSPCDPCPKHGSPAELSEELREMAPKMLGYVCSETNRLADDDLNDLCSLMYKHAKCSEVQRRVELVRDKLKSEADSELFRTKQQLARQFGVQ